jgi:prolipoprotein diacylglyceryltransferase
VVFFYLPGGVPVYLYPFIVGMGATVGLAWSVLRASSKNCILIANAGLAAILGGMIAGRLFYVLTDWSNFQGQGLEIFQIYLGGFSWVGALLGASLFTIGYGFIKRFSPLRLLDSLVPFVGVVVMSIWLASWLDGYAYGRAADWWWEFPARDGWGRLAPRFPVQVIGALTALGTIWAAEFLTKFLTVPGQITAATAYLMSLVYFLLAFTRIDYVETFLGFRIDALIALTITVVSGGYLLISWRQNAEDKKDSF